MKTLKEALFSRKNIKSNPFGLTKDDLIGNLKGFPMGVVVRMLEEQESQSKKSDVKVFQKNKLSLFKGFDWDYTNDGFAFWNDVIVDKNFDLFFEKYPDYKRYNL